MKKLIKTAAVFAAAMAVMTLWIFFTGQNNRGHNGEYAVELNEIEQLCRKGEETRAADMAAQLRVRINKEDESENNYSVLMMGGICLVFLAGITAYGCVTLVLPFDRLSALAERVARGELDIPLEYERTNYFGKFTWAFDSMRAEIKKARSCEREAIENNKTVIATLSHDIKTPVASIRAYAEALELGMDGDPEKRSRYIGVIMNKCDEVSKLTEDMLMHSLSDMDRLTMKTEKLELTDFLENVLAELDAGRGDIIYEKPMFSAEITADKVRLEQLTENLINNARKYAKTEVRVSVSRTEHTAVMHFRDSGGGIPEADLPFIWEKFYRGGNSKNEKGTGLGLYIVKYIAERSGGSASLRNCGNGLEVTVSLPLAGE